MPTADWSLPALPQSVSALRAQTVAFASAHGVPADTVSGLALATSEVLTNAVQHAFPAGAPGTIGVRIAIAIDAGHGRVDLVAFDNGLGMTVRPDRPGFGPGLAIVSRVTSEFEVRPADGDFGTEVRMTFLIGAVGLDATPLPSPPALTPPPAEDAITVGVLGAGARAKLALGLLGLGSAAVWGVAGYELVRLVL